MTNLDLQPNPNSSVYTERGAAGLGHPDYLADFDAQTRPDVHYPTEEECRQMLDHELGRIVVKDAFEN